MSGRASTTMARRGLGAAGAVLCAGAVMLAAYASHGAAATAQATLQLAAVFAFGHGLALAALAPLTQRHVGLLALAALLLGALLFSGATAVAELLSVRARTAPFGGGLLIVGWLLYAVDALRSR